MTDQVSIKDVVENVFDDGKRLAMRIEKAGLSIDYHLTISEGNYLPRLVGDEGPLFARDITELIMNAYKSMFGIKERMDLLRPKGPLVFAGDGIPDLGVSLATLEYDYLVTVSDNGPGIAPEDLPHIWTPEFSRFGTSGLGLYMARRSFSRMGGRIEVKSEPGKGATFKVYVPINPY